MIAAIRPHGPAPTTRSVAGTDFGMRDGTDVAMFGNAVLQAEAYRSGRVLLAGDSAHIHLPLGGQGMNLGLADATNLGWKLAAVIRGWAAPDLIDSYDTERHPMGERVVADVRAQTALVVDGSADGAALRARFNDMLAAHPSLNRELATRLAGFAFGYPAPPGAHPLVGHRMPDLDLIGAPAPSVFGLLREPRFVLLDLGGGPRRSGPAIVTVAATAMVSADRPEWREVDAVLIRPDGHIGWVGGAATADREDDLDRALACWSVSSPVRR